MLAIVPLISRLTVYFGYGKYRHAGDDQALPNECVGTALSLGKGLTNAPNALFSNPAVNAESAAAESAECLDNRFFSGQNYPDPPTASNELCMPKGASKSYVDVGPGDPVSGHES